MLREQRFKSLLFSLFCVGILLFSVLWVSQVTAQSSGRVRSYYIAADEVDWDYAPTGSNQITGQPFDDQANVYVKSGPDRIGKVYRKALYREYTDATFTQLKPRPPQWAHLGTLGPVIQAEVGDTIRVEFRNNTRLPASVHPHGVFYLKNAEGAPYQDGTNGAERQDGAVPPGGQYVYIWQVPERAGPGPADGSSVFWMYHSHTNEIKDTYSGLVGPMMITAKGKAKPDGSPKDVDREIVMMYLVSDENSSWYLDENIKKYATNPASVKTDDDDFVESNLMHSINGYVFGNMPMPTIKKGERVRWYLLGMGTEVDLHTPHWHGNTGLMMMGMRSDMIDLLPGDMDMLDMRPDNVGIWLLHCHVNDHIKAGMQTRYQVLP